MLVILNTNFHGEGGVFVLGQILLEHTKMHRYWRWVVKFAMIAGVSTQVLLYLYFTCIISPFFLLFFLKKMYEILLLYNYMKCCVIY
jgi:hypothetical protein